VFVSQYLVDEQLQHKKSLYLMSFGSELESLWKHARDVNIRTYVALCVPLLCSNSYKIDC